MYIILLEIVPIYKLFIALNFTGSFLLFNYIKTIFLVFIQRNFYTVINIGFKTIIRRKEYTDRNNTYDNESVAESDPLITSDSKSNRRIVSFVGLKISS